MVVFILRDVLLIHVELLGHTCHWNLKTDCRKCTYQKLGMYGSLGRKVLKSGLKQGNTSFFKKWKAENYMSFTSISSLVFLLRRFLVTKDVAWFCSVDDIKKCNRSCMNRKRKSSYLYECVSYYFLLHSTRYYSDWKDSNMFWDHDVGSSFPNLILLLIGWPQH